MGQGPSSIEETVVGPVDAIYSPFVGQPPRSLTAMPRVAGHNATTVASMRLVWHNNLVLWPTVIRSGAAVHDPGK